jgi:hypothetical protein
MGNLLVLLGDVDDGRVEDDHQLRHEDHGQDPQRLGSGPSTLRSSGDEALAISFDSTMFPFLGEPEVHAAQDSNKVKGKDLGS